MTVVEPGGLWGPLSDALAGGSVVAPAADAATVAMLRPDVPVAEPDAALIVATSGSTGRPKGVVLSRAALAASASATHERLGGPGTWHCALPTTYVAGVMTLVRAHFAGTEPVFVASDLSDLLAGVQRNYLSLVPTQLHRALDDPGLVDRLAAFDAVLLGGAAIAPELRGRAEASGITIVATYGMSETCGGCVYDGVPLPGVSIDLATFAGGGGDLGAEWPGPSPLDPHTSRSAQESPVGRVLIGGPMLFSGYRLDPDASAAALAGGRFLTSDRGQLDADGRLRILGRVDDVVISGGVNVDLAAAQAVADAVLGTPEAGGIVLAGVPDAHWGTKVVAVTASELTTDEVRTRLAARLGREALPWEVRRVDSLPRTANGKIDRRRIITTWR